MNSIKKQMMMAACVAMCYCSVAVADTNPPAVKYDVPAMPTNPPKTWLT